MCADSLDSCYVDYLGHGFMLGQRRDAIERLTIASSLPVCLELLTVKRGPLPDESKRPVRQRSAQDLQRLDCDRRIPTGIQGMEMRDAVLGVLHRDRYPIELADPRHADIVQVRPDEPEVLSVNRC